MKYNRATGPTGVSVKMLKTCGDNFYQYLSKLFNQVIYNGVQPDDWNTSYIINLYKGKGDALERGNFRGLKLLEHVMKVMENILDKIIRSQVKIDA